MARRKAASRERAPAASGKPEWKPETLVIGGAGAIGRRLIAALVERDGAGSVVAGLRRSELPEELAACCCCEYGVDVRKAATVRALLDKYKASLKRVWNLAAPLSVETARDPRVAREVVVGGMETLLECMREAEVRTLLFSDSIGSFGAEAPRADATARWLTEHRAQDPGSDYGRQKRECRDLMRRYAREHGFDCRWAVIPGVLHDDDAWGARTGAARQGALETVEARVPRGSLWRRSLSSRGSLESSGGPTTTLREGLRL